MKRGATAEMIGCCGAFCGTCKPFATKACRGCQLGYKDGMRDITKAKCAIKKCCMKHKYISCADCRDQATCEILQTFYSKNGYKYKKYQEAIGFIKKNGIKRFLEITKNWTMQYGKYK